MAIVFAVVTITFFVVHLAQGTPCGGERPLPPDVCERERAVFGYDKPLQVQYVKYLAALLHGKMGYSFGLHRPVADALASASVKVLGIASASASATPSRSRSPPCSSPSRSASRSGSIRPR